MRGLARYHVKDETEVIVSRHTALVKQIAYHLAARLPDSVRVDDLVQAGLLGLLEAAHRYDPAQGASFATFVERRIRGAMLDEIRKGDWTPRSVHRKAREVAAAIRAVENAKGGEARDSDIAAQLGLSLADYHKTLTDLRGQKLLSIEALGPEEKEGVERLASLDPEPAERLQQEQLIKGLAAAIAELPERERLVLSLYYDEGLNLKEIGAILAVSESRVSQLHSQALVRLRARVNS